MERQGHASTYRLSLPITTGRADDVFTFLPPAGQGGSCRCGQEFCTLTRLDLDEQGVVHGLASGAMRFVSVLLCPTWLPHPGDERAGQTVLTGLRQPLGSTSGKSREKHPLSAALPKGLGVLGRVLASAVYDEAWPLN